MKHLFIVHNHVVYLTSLKVIERLGLSPENVVFGTHRSYSVGDSRFTNVFSLPADFPITRNFIKNRCEMNKWYRDFNRYIGSDYIAYVPQTFKYGALVVTQSKCLSFNYMEEGLASYNPRNFIKVEIPRWRLWLNTCIYTSRTLVRFLFERRFFDLDAPKLNKCYALSELSFSGTERRVVLDFALTGRKEKSQYDCVVVFDALSVFKLIENDIILEMLENVIIPDIKTRGFEKIAFKLHPEHYVRKQGQAEGEKIREVMHRYFIQVEELDKAVSLEVYFSQYDVAVYSYISALGYYAMLMGCVSYRLAKQMAAINPKIRITHAIEDKMQQL